MPGRRDVEAMLVEEELQDTPESEQSPAQWLSEGIRIEQTK